MQLYQLVMLPAPHPVIGLGYSALNDLILAVMELSADL